MKAKPIGVSFSVCASAIAATAVPPVAMTSSAIRTRVPGFTRSRWVSIVDVPYSSVNSSRALSPGSFPGFRASKSPDFHRAANPAATRNPRASIPRTTSGGLASKGFPSASSARAHAWPSAQSGVRSRKRTPA